MRPISLPNNAETITRDAGPAPMLQWLEVTDLVVDDRYQRPLLRHNWKNIQNIAEQFLWSRFSPVLCAPVAGGKFAIIDGQHRVHAAALCGHEQVPCQIVQMDLEEQASSFKSVNANTTKVTGLNIARAALIAGEQWAIDCKTVAEEGGCRIMFSNSSSKDKVAGQIYAIASFRKIVESKPHHIISKALRILIKTEGFNSEKQLWGGAILSPVLQAITDHPQILDDESFPEFLNYFDIWDAIDGLADENRRRMSRGEKRLTRSDFIYQELKAAIQEAYLSINEVMQEASYENYR